MLEAILGYLGPCLGHLGSSWAPQPLGAPPPQIRGDRAGAEVGLSPKGKKEAGRRNALNHVFPQGLVGFLSSSCSRLPSS
eukprot:6413050-Pyramimonas_sp.AAC.1